MDNILVSIIMILILLIIDIYYDLWKKNTQNKLYTELIEERDEKISRIVGIIKSEEDTMNKLFIDTPFEQNFGRYGTAYQEISYIKYRIYKILGWEV